MNTAAWIEIDAAHILRHLSALFDEAHCQQILLVTPHPVEWQARLKRSPLSRQLNVAVADSGNFLSAPGARAFDGIASIDSHERIPQAERKRFYHLLLQQARAVLYTAPLGTELQKLFYQSLSSQYRETFGREFEPLASALRFGLPTPDEILHWIASNESADLFYSGDVDDFRTQAERLLNSSRWQRFLRRLTESALSQPPQVQDELHLLETVPMRRHRRLYVYSLRK